MSPLPVVDVFSRHRGPHKDEIVVKIIAVKNFGAHRVKKGLGQLRLMVIGQQPDVVQLDLLPDLHRQVFSLEVTLQSLISLLHTQVIELDPLTLRALLTMPVGLLKAKLGLGTGFSEQPVVAIKTFQHRLGDVERLSMVEFGWEHPVGSKNGGGVCAHRHGPWSVGKLCRTQAAERLTPFRKTTLCRSAYGGFRSCLHRFHTTWHHAKVGQAGSR